LRETTKAGHISASESARQSQTIDPQDEHMTDVTLEFLPFSAPRGGVLVLFCDQSLTLPPAAAKILRGAEDLIKRAAKVENFKGKSGSVLALPVPHGVPVERLIVVGAGDVGKLEANDLTNLGGAAMGSVPASARDVTVLAELPGKSVSADRAADIALGARLRAYSFDLYKTKKTDGENKPARKKVMIAVSDVAAARKAYAPREAIAEGVVGARDLVNEPANILYPQEFARRAALLKKHRVSVEILDVRAMQKLGMFALLGVGQGSSRDSRLVVMRWNGGKKGEAPVAFVGKGVCFDTGGISIKPAGGMEDMKGDMAGAACVVGLMHALARRKAKVNAVGVIGVVENMPDGNAQRPGDIVKSMSGQTIEIINTDAEGRLVLADALWYTATKFKPKFMVDLATLTGAIIVALGHEHAGLFSNDNRLAERLTKAGLETGELVWRMPLSKEYDKQIDSKFADVKNTGGSRWAGAITAAQFLQRFVAAKTPWAHLDIAGTGFDSRQSDINKSWGSGWGVRLLDRLVAEHYEA
jgi:leucyl aminopeptidase